MIEIKEDTRHWIKKWNLMLNTQIGLIYCFLLALMRIPWQNLDTDPRQSVKSIFWS